MVVLAVDFLVTFVSYPFMCVCVSVSVDSNDISFNLRSTKWFKPLSLWTHLRWKYINQVLWNNEGNIKLLVCSNGPEWRRVSHLMMYLIPGSRVPKRLVWIILQETACMPPLRKLDIYDPSVNSKFPLVFMFPQFSLSLWPQEVQLNTLIPLVFPFKCISKLFRLLFNIQTVVTFSKYLVASEVIPWEVKRYLACTEIKNQGSMAQHYVENKSQ